MILQAVIDLLVGLVKLCFGWINLPPLPSQIQAVLDMVLGYMRDGIGILAWFVDMDYVLILVPIVIVIINFDKVYRLTMFILRKLPIGIE